MRMSDEASCIGRKKAFCSGAAGVCMEGFSRVKNIMFLPPGISTYAFLITNNERFQHLPFNFKAKGAALLSLGDLSQYGHCGSRPPGHTTPRPPQTDRMAITACPLSITPPLVDILHRFHL